MRIAINSLYSYGLHNYESYVTSVFLSLIHRLDIVIGIGANIEYYSLLRASWEGPKICVFEANLDNFTF
jgi:hypothetical protein